MNLFFGEHPSKWNIALSLLTGFILVGVAVMLQEPLGWNGIVTAFLAADIGAGLISNASKETNDAWKNESRSRQWVFVIFHLTVYPAAIILLSQSEVVTILFVGLLVVKTGLFYSRVMSTAR
jgi:hypothetical protein